MASRVGQQQKTAHCEYPCPCGHYGDAEKPCTCTMSMVDKYRKRISGPILDRIDIHLDVPRVPAHKLTGLEDDEFSAVGRMGLSARAYHRILKLARTIADLAGSE